MDEVQMALYALHKTRKLRYVAHSGDPMTPALKGVITRGKQRYLETFEHDEYSHAEEYDFLNKKPGFKQGLIVGTRLNKKYI